MTRLTRLGAAAFLAAFAGPVVGLPAPKASPQGAPPCAGVTLPRRLTTAPANLPASFTATRIGGAVVDEAVIGPDGAVSDVRLVWARLAELAPFGEKSVRDSRFAPGAVDGHPAAIRVQVSTTLGTVSRARHEPTHDSLWAYVPGGQSREAVWQLAGSVSSLALEIHLGSPTPAGARVVAVAPAGKERVLREIPASAQPQDLRETVATGDFLEPAGEYHIELRASDRTLVSARVTIADDYTRAIVNACAPL